MAPVLPERQRDSEMNITEWLVPAQRLENDFSFEVTDIEETPAVPQAADLAELLADSYWGNEYLEGLASRYGFDEVQQRFLGSALRPQLGSQAR